MMVDKLSPGSRVVVGNLLRLPAYNRQAFENYEPGKPLPAFFSTNELSARHEPGSVGTLRGVASHQLSRGMFVVDHDDGTHALYHSSELVSAEALAEQRDVKTGGFIPLKRSLLRGIAFEIYEGIAGAELPSDCLIMPLNPGVSNDEGDELPQQQPAPKAGRSDLAQALDAALKMTSPLQTTAAKIAGRPFASVLFINGIRPTMDAIDATMRRAKAEGARSIVLPLRQFEGFEGLEDDLRFDDILQMLDIMAEVADVSFETIKIAL